MRYFELKQSRHYKQPLNRYKYNSSSSSPLRMSYLTSPCSVRLQDLKLWQGNYDNLIKSKCNEITQTSDFDTIQGLSAFDSILSSPVRSPGKHVDWDKKAITPTKPFEQLLEEKLAEDVPTLVKVKPKQPFLKKGTGLIRYRLTPRSANVRLSRKIQATSVLSEGRIQKSEESLQQLKHCSNKSLPAGDVTELSITPLKVPDLYIKPKATWSKYLEDEETRSEAETDFPEGQVTPRGVFTSHLFGKLNELALKHIMPSSPRKSVRISQNNVLSDYTKLNNDNFLQTTDQSSENTTDKELHIFETLEERAENSSFCSTNSSIIRLLSSTPNKVKPNLVRSPIFEEKAEELKSFADNRTLVQKLQEVNRKTDVLNDFLQNLRKISSDKHNTIPEKPALEETSYSEEEKWSRITDTRSQSPSSTYTDFENTFKSAPKVDSAVNTSFKEIEEISAKTDGCPGCKELRRKLSRLSEDVPNIQAEKARVCDFAKDLERKRDQLSKEIDKLKKKYEEDVGDLRQELEGEKKKFVREKAVFDMYIKESQNRPNKKEREEITSLKKELADVKELLKLKETKNGATQARLRNTVKQLEKEQTELKGTVDSLQKENAKLKAAQKVRKPSDSKMLQEINKNLSKLTEETFKKQLNKSDPELKRDRRKSTEKVRENCEMSPKLVRRQPSNLKKKSSLHRDAVDDSETSEKQNENVFEETSDLGQQNSTTDDSRRGTKTEKVFPDGSKETKYSNGNSKTVSPDGNLVIFQYYNGDIKETNLTEHTIKYYYAENATWHTQFGDGSELLEFPNGQQERKYKDGRKEVVCPDGRTMTKMPDDSEEVVYPDGSKFLKSTSGEKILILPNGQKEIHTKEHKRREYPDGTVKIIYPDGTQETRYASGRLRIKDANGVLIVDVRES